MQKIETSSLDAISKTMLITLYMRYLESKLEDGLIKSNVYSQIISKLGYDFSFFKDDDELELFIASRTLIFDNALKSFTRKNPDCVVVNLACGLDARFFVNENINGEWFDLDLPEVIRIRKELFGSVRGLNYISSSVFDFSWINKIPKNKKTLFIAEGLLLYFTESEVRTLFMNLLYNFTNANIIFDVISENYLEYLSIGKPKYINWDKTPFRWAVNHYSQIESYHERIEFVNEWYLVDNFGKRCPAPLNKQLEINPQLKHINKVMQFCF
jgi:O-methyltransferase involved in polyketide biosynthesis